MSQLDQAAARHILDRLCNGQRAVQRASGHQPWPIGTVLRYGAGSTALMLVEEVSEHHGGPGQHRYWGRQCMGGVRGAYEGDCSLASALDLATWARLQLDRQPR